MTEFDPYARSREQFHAISRQRHLDSTVRVTRLIGILFLLIGGLAILLINADSRRTPAFALTLVSGFVVLPGILYLVASVFLRQRRYWAWMTTFVITLLLLLLVLTFSAGLFITVARSNNPGEGLMPTIAFSCLFIALSSILFSLRKCLPAILETEQQSQHGFAVIPVAHVAPPTDPPLLAISPYSSPPDP